MCFALYKAFLYTPIGGFFYILPILSVFPYIQDYRCLFFSLFCPRFLIQRFYMAYIQLGLSSFFFLFPPPEFAYIVRFLIYREILSSYIYSVFPIVKITLFCLYISFFFCILPRLQCMFYRKYYHFFSQSYTMYILYIYIQENQTFCSIKICVFTIYIE